MDNTLAWAAVATTGAVLAGYEITLAVAQRRRPEGLARSAHARLRQQWFEAVSAQPGSEILAVQTLRNSLMSASMTASAAALGLMGTVTLALPSLHSGLAGALPGSTLRLVLGLALMALLLASLVSSAMAVRDYHHVSFISAMPVHSEARQRWAGSGAAYVRRAGVLYSWGLRYLILVAPVLAALLHPLAGPVAALALVAVLTRFDRLAGPPPAA